MCLLLLLWETATHADVFCLLCSCGRGEPCCHNGGRPISPANDKPQPQQGQVSRSNALGRVEIDGVGCAVVGGDETSGDPSDQGTRVVTPLPGVAVENHWGETDAVGVVPRRRVVKLLCVDLVFRDVARG